MDKLEESHYAKLIPLFTSDLHDPMLYATLEGARGGRVFIDNALIPKAGEAFDHTFALKAGSGEDYLKGSIAWAKTGEPDKVVTYLEQAIGDGLLNLNEIGNESAFEIMRGLESWKKLMSTQVGLGGK
jgi:hypothetical protein